MDSSYNWALYKCPITISLLLLLSRYRQVPGVAVMAASPRLAWITSVMSEWKRDPLPPELTTSSDLDAVDKIQTTDWRERTTYYRPQSLCIGEKEKRIMLVFASHGQLRHLVTADSYDCFACVRRFLCHSKIYRLLTILWYLKDFVKRHSGINETVSRLSAVVSYSYI